MIPLSLRFISVCLSLVLATNPAMGKGQTYANRQKQSTNHLAQKDDFSRQALIAPVNRIRLPIGEMPSATFWVSRQAAEILRQPAPTAWLDTMAATLVAGMITAWASVISDSLGWAVLSPGLTLAVMMPRRAFLTGAIAAAASLIRRDTPTASFRLVNARTFGLEMGMSPALLDVLYGDALAQADVLILSRAQAIKLNADPQVEFMLQIMRIPPFGSSQQMGGFTLKANELLPDNLQLALKRVLGLGDSVVSSMLVLIADNVQLQELLYAHEASHLLQSPQPTRGLPEPNDYVRIPIEQEAILKSMIVFRDRRPSGSFFDFIRAFQETDYARGLSNNRIGELAATPNTYYWALKIFWDEVDAFVVSEGRIVPEKIPSFLEAARARVAQALPRAASEPVRPRNPGSPLLASAA